MTTTSWGRSGSWDSLPDPETASAPGTSEPRGTFDFVLFAGVTMMGLELSGFPLSELAAGAAVLLGLARAPRVKPSLGVVALLLIALAGLLAYSAHANDLSPYRRLAHVLLYVLLSVVASQGRFHQGAMARGLASGLVVSAGAWFVGFGQGYEGRLTGLLADPNTAGYALTTLGCLALGGMAGSRYRWLAGVLIGVAIVLTFSRTSILATALVLVWMVLGRRVSTLFGSMLLGLMLYVVTNIPSSVQQIGPFSDRSGSDALRARIVAQERLLIGDAPWYGNGPGTSHADVQGETFFFHNSYLALQNEGGRLAVALLVAAGLVALLGLMRLPMSSRNFWFEGAVIALAVCAVNLGEVLLELPAALVLGVAVWHARRARQAGAPPPPDPALARRDVLLA